MRTSCGHQCVPFESTCVCVSQGFLWEKPDPDSSPANRPALSFFFFFSFSSLPSSLCFVYSPRSSPTLSFPPPSSPTLSTLPQTRSDLAAACVPTSYRCVYPPCVCLNSPQRELALFGEAKENSNVEDTPRRRPRWITALSHGTKGCHTFKI